MFSERCQTANDLVEAGVEIQQMLVNWQLHALSPPAGNAVAAAVASALVWIGTSAFDVILSGISCRGGAAVMTFLTLASHERKSVPERIWRGNQPSR